MAKIKVGLCCRHAGLIKVLLDLWRRDFDVRLREKYRGLPHIYECPPFQGDEDIVVSTLHHFDMLNDEQIAAIAHRCGDGVVKPLSPAVLANKYDGKMPVIMYVTDPTLPEVKQAVEEHFSKQPWFRAIGAENCYAEHQVPPVEKYIPFALDPARYPMYKGGLDKALVVNRKALERLWAATDVMKEPRPQQLAAYLKGLPWHLAQEPNETTFHELYRDHRVLFYWSNSPYTIVLFEAMLVGMPIVALPSECVGPEDPHDKYLMPEHHCKSTQEAVAKVRSYLDGPPPPRLRYNFTTFDEARQMWTETITEIVEGSK